MNEQTGTTRHAHLIRHYQLQLPKQGNQIDQ